MTTHFTEPAITEPAITGNVPRAHHLAAIGFLCLMAVFWNVVEELPVLLSPGYSLYQVVWMRYAVHLLFLVALLAPRLGWNLVRTRRPALQVGRGLLMLVMPYCFIRALAYMQTHNLLAVFWCVPLLILALVVLFKQARVPGWTWLVTAVACVGALLILRPDAGVLNTGALFAAGMAASFGLYVVLTRVLRHESTYANLFYTAACVFVPLSLLMPLVWKMPTPRDMLVMAGVGLAGLALLWALDRACELAPVPALAPWLLLPPVVTLVLHTLGTGTLPARLALAGATLILAVLLYALYRTLRHTQAVHPAVHAGHRVEQP